MLRCCHCQDSVRSGADLTEDRRTPLTTSATPAREKPCSRARCSGRAAGDSSGSGCGRRWPRSRRRSGCSSRCPGSGSGCRCRRSAAPSALVAFFVLAVAATVPLFQVRWPTAIEGLRRLDRNSLLPHRPGHRHRRPDGARGRRSVRGRALARASGARACAPRARSRPAIPSPQACGARSFALRALVLILVAATFVAAGSDRVKRVAAAFDWHGVVIAGELPDRRLGHAAGLYRPAAADPAGPASRRAVAGAQHRGR